MKVIYLKCGFKGSLKYVILPVFINAAYVVTRKLNSSLPRYFVGSVEILKKQNKIQLKKTLQGSHTSNFNLTLQE